MKKYRNWIGLLGMTICVVCVVGFLVLQNKPSIEKVTYPEFMNLAELGEVTKVTLTDADILYFHKKGMETKFMTDNPRNPELKEKLLLLGVDAEEGKAGSTDSLLQTLVSIVFFGGAFYFVYRMSNKQNMRSVMELNVTNSAEGKSNGFSFADVAGNEEAKEGVQDIVDFIRNPDKYAQVGARMPRGIIFYGPPGTGKTLMAKALAGEAGVPFFAVSGSDFVQMYVGIGASRIRDLFKKARESGKAVIFIDEIDALGKKRGTAVGGGNDERDQTLNALLTEMSGFASESGIVVIAATNRLDTLDEALLRPGRFDRQVEIGLPDVNARERILRLHAKNKPVSEAVNLRKLAGETVYFSGAMLENLLNEAAIFAAKDGVGQIESVNIEKAYYTVLAGSEKKDRSTITERDKQVTAYHEAGHALIAKIAAPENKVSKITIIPSTKGAGGFCVNIPPDKMYYTKKELEAQIMISFGGRAAEEIIFGRDNVTTGAGNDIEKATAIGRDYVCQYGMSEKVGLVNLRVLDEKGNAECIALLEKLYEETKKIISQNQSILEKIADELLDKETLDEQGLDRIIQQTA